MPKTKELNFEQRIAVRYLRESGLSYREIGKQGGCHHSTTVKSYNKCATTGWVEHKERLGHPNTVNERGERVICRAARRLKFSTLKNIVSDIKISQSYQNATTSLVRKILHKYRLYSFQRKRKPYISLKNRAYRHQWAKVLSEWPAEYWNDVVFLMNAVLVLKMSRKCLGFGVCQRKPRNQSFSNQDSPMHYQSCAGDALGLMGLGSWLFVTRKWLP